MNIDAYCYHSVARAPRVDEEHGTPLSYPGRNCAVEPTARHGASRQKRDSIIDPSVYDDPLR
jgi:hypothetical protein